MSGLQIFNAHPALNFGKSSYNGTPPVLEIGARESTNGQVIGVTRYSAGNSTPQDSWARRAPTASRSSRRFRRG